MFYADGSPQKTYMVSDLVLEADAVWWSITMAQWIGSSPQGARELSFDAESNLLTITTVDRQTYVFDITSGEIFGDSNVAGGGALENGRQPSRISRPQLIVSIAAGIVAFIVGVRFLAVKRKR